MDAREQRGLEIATRCKVTRKDDGWSVPSMSGNGRYTVKLGEGGLFPTDTCTCPDYENRGGKCKHIWAVQFAATRETEQHADGSTTVTESVTVTATKRTTYPQDWPAYNAAQTHEQDQFQRLLNELCAGIVSPPAGKGRPRLPLSDV